MKRSFLLLLCAISSAFFARGQSAHTLWYTRPAQYFEETLVLGNGKTGASVFGGITTDKIYLNDATLWSGEPVDAYMNPEAYKNLPAIREALQREDYKTADELNKKLQGKFSESYAPLGTLWIGHRHGSATAAFAVKNFNPMPGCGGTRKAKKTKIWKSCTFSLAAIC